VGAATDQIEEEEEEEEEEDWNVIAVLRRRFMT